MVVKSQTHAKASVLVGNRMEEEGGLWSGCSNGTDPTAAPEYTEDRGFQST